MLLQAGETSVKYENGEKIVKAEAEKRNGKIHPSTNIEVPQKCQNQAPNEIKS